MNERSLEGAVAEHVDVPDAQSALLETCFGNEGKIEYVDYSRLRKSPRNVRTKPSTGIAGLAENIGAKGLMQNLVVHVMKGSRSKHPQLGVCAGQRRLAALDVLFESGRIAANHPVPVKIVSEADALAASLIENKQREPMHISDASVAFALLLEEGRSVDYIAALFTTSALVVRRNLKLANVSPKLLDVFRDDGMTFEQISALALSDDHATQERLWFNAAQSWLRDPHQLRAAITSEEIDVRNNPLVSFVTLDAYEAAGGFVRRDLFSDTQNAGYIGDAALLQRLATERLMVLAQDVAAEGCWQFVETRVKRDHSELSAYGRLSSHSRDMTKKEKTEFSKLQKARDTAAKALDAYYDEDSEVEDDDKREALEDAANAASEACDRYVERLESWTPEQMASAGAFLLLNHAGQVVIERGLVKPENKAAAQHSGIDSEASLITERKAKPVHGEKLCRRLTAHRTAAVQVELAANPSVALAVLMHSLIPTVFCEHYKHEFNECAIEVQARCSADKLLREADDMASSLAWREIESERKKWSAMLPRQVAHLLPWLLEQSDDVMANLFAFCVAATLDSVSGVDRAHSINSLCDLLNVDMTKYWTPTPESYFDHVSKARIVEVVSVAVSLEAAAPLASMKKDEATKAAEIRLAGSGWLPEVLTNRETPKVYSYGASDDDEVDESGVAAEEVEHELT